MQTSHHAARLLTPVLALALALPATTSWAAPPPAPPSETESDSGDEADATSSTAEDGSHPGGAYGETVDYDWDHGNAPPLPDTGPQVTIEVHNSLRPVYLRRGDEAGEEVCEAPCARRIGDASGQFVLAGPNRKASKPFSLSGGDSLRLVAKGGKPSRAALGIIVMIVGVGAAVGLAVAPTRVNMPKTAGLAMWAGAGVVGVVALSTGLVLFRFSRTQVKVLAD